MTILPFFLHAIVKVLFQAAQPQHTIIWPTATLGRGRGRGRSLVVFGEACGLTKVYGPMSY